MLCIYNLGTTSERKISQVLSETGLINLMIITSYIHFLVNDITLCLWMKKSIMGCERDGSVSKRASCVSMRTWIQTSSTHVKSQEWSYSTVTHSYSCMASSRSNERSCPKGIERNNGLAASSSCLHSHAHGCLYLHIHTYTLSHIFKYYNAENIHCICNTCITFFLSIPLFLHT